MGRPSRLFVSAEKRGGAVTAVRVGGQAVVVSAGTLYLRPAPNVPNTRVPA